MITFTEIPSEQIYTTHNEHYFDQARYFQICDGDKSLCIYGVVAHSKITGEAFWVLDSFNKDVLSKKFFKDLFEHLFSLGFKVIYTWTRCKKLTNVFSHYKNLGIEKIGTPSWDNDESKTWFMKRI